MSNSPERPPWRWLRSLFRHGPPPNDSGRRSRNDLPTVQLDYPGVAVWLYATSKIERHVRAATCAKEPWTTRWIETELATGGVLYDIGANVGVFSLLAALLNPGATKVLAFEPGSATFARLCDNIALNGCDAAIVPIPLPLWSSNRVIHLMYRDTTPGAARHRLRRTSTPDRARRPRRDQPVLASRLDDLIARYKLPLPTHIKLDVDGAELDVLTGAKHTLNEPGLRTLMVETEPKLEIPVTQLLTDSGFGVEARYQRTASAPGYLLFRRR